MIYIIQFSSPLGNERHQAHFYIGSCRDDLIDQRIADHRSGTGAAITRAAVNKGIQLNVIALLSGGRKEERELKKHKNTRRVLKKLMDGRMNYDYLDSSIRL